MSYTSPYTSISITPMSGQRSRLMSLESSAIVAKVDDSFSRHNDLDWRRLNDIESLSSILEPADYSKKSNTPNVLPTHADENSALTTEILARPNRDPGSLSGIHASNSKCINERLDCAQPIRCAKLPPEGAAHLWPETNLCSMASSLVAEHDEISSNISLHSSKTTSSIETKSNQRREAKFTPVKESIHQKFNIGPKLSIPADIEPTEYARQCIAAAESSRLDPYNLHPEEYTILRRHITYQQVTTYLNIRNGILRLWVRNPTIGVTPNEAIGCAKDTRWLDVASLSHEWLVRRGYINYGCLDLSDKSFDDSQHELKLKRRVVVVVGAGMSGLGCARQLEGLFIQFEDRFQQLGEDTPRVIVVEGRDRIGGRVYSRAFNTKPKNPTLNYGSRHTAEMGGMIITGFDRGNPLNVIVRGQLALNYHKLKPDTTIYDSNGISVDADRDQLAEKLFNYILDRVSEYKFKVSEPVTIDGDKDLIDAGREPSNEGSKTIFETESSARKRASTNHKEKNNVHTPVKKFPISAEKSFLGSELESNLPIVHTAAFKAREIGWVLKPGVGIEYDLDLESCVNSKDATLGSVFDEAIRQYSNIVDFTPLDLQLINWHVANLEYSNAITCNRLSLGGWDLDAGNEWEGKHTMVMGGYQQVPRGIFKCPQPLTVRKKSKVVKIIHNPDLEKAHDVRSKIEFEDGDIVEADCIVSTLPLGVLKQKSVQFEPLLPGWKEGAIRRIGYGILNKIILVYHEAFWDEDRDIFGTLRNAPNQFSLDQADYFSQRGRFFQWFNVSNTTGLPTLLALMAGDAAFATESTSNEELLSEATRVLRTVFGPSVPSPIETIVTRWGHDEFSRGSYSYTGPHFEPFDYGAMAKPIGNLFFAGEHTCGTHPATVHGAYISGLRAASEVLDFLIGDIKVPEPLVPPKDLALKRKPGTVKSPRDPKQIRLEAYEAEIWNAIYEKLGERPWRPPNNYANPYRLYSKVKWEEAKRRCEEGRRPGKGKAIPNEVKKMVTKLWKEETDEVKKPYNEQAEIHKKAYTAALAEYNAKVNQWDKDALAFRSAYEKEHPSVPGPEELSSPLPWDRRAKRVVSGYAEDTDSEMETY
ncbi:unnamed protein product [Blumeria hordei]|uniref:Uncharacterized protein n=1 Tax=Blumeria hordei TaxID=2867405 RepID=A0A383UT28_BLUHO|nr:unnamed protein product [Blumeria hordei]